MNVLLGALRRAYQLLFTGGVMLPSGFLVLLRLYFFWQLFLTGKGKLLNISKVSEFFASLGFHCQRSTLTLLARWSALGVYY
jgi:uncharacterized membrane protein YphA (DoxX/SURF4 family)